MLPPPADDALDTEKLLAEGRALRALARTLVGGSDAEDVVQEGFAKALAAPVAPRRGLGPWLTGTVRNLAGMLRRREARRQARERIAARDEFDAGSDPAVIAAQAEVIHAVAAAVKALDEPFRTVIVLRFWHGLLPEAIAQRLGVPRNTVRSRLQRGLERLRAQLDGKCGDRERWSAPLFAFAGVEPSVTASGAAAGGGFLLFTVMLMKTKLFVAAAAALAAVCCIPLLWKEPAAADRVASVRQEAQPVAATSGIERTEAAAGEPTREEVAGPTQKEPPAEVPFDPSPVKVTPWLVRFLVVDEDEKPIEDATITIWASKRVKVDAQRQELFGSKNNVYSGREQNHLLELHTDAEGHASTMLELESLVALAAKAGVRSSEASLWNTRSNAAETKLVLVAPLLLRGRVVRADGSPGAGAEVTTRVNGFSTMQRGRAPQPEPVVADAEGRFAVPVTQHGGYSLSATLDGKKSFSEQLFVQTKTLPEVLLTFPGAITITGVVVDADGQPVVKADLRVWREYRLGDPKQDGDDYETAYAETDAGGRFSVDVRQHRRYQLVASADGCANSAAVWVEPTAARPHVEVRLALQRFTTVRGTVQHGDGSPFAGVQVSARLDDPNAGAVAVASKSDLFQGSKATKSGDDGRFELTVHPGTNWTVVAWPLPDNFQFAFREDDVKPGRDDVTFTIRDEDLVGCIVSGEVVTAADAQPLAAFKVDLVVFGADGKADSRPTKASIEGNRFELPPVPIGRSYAIDVTPTDASKPLERAHIGAPLAPSRVGPFTTSREGVRLEVRVQAWAELPVQVLRVDGTPARGLIVSAAREPHIGNSWRSPQRVEADGRRTLKQLVPGQHRLLVHDDTVKLHELEVTVVPGLNPEVVVRLPAAANAGTGR